MEEKIKEFKIICPFCNAPYTPKMEMELTCIGGGCESCGYGGAAEGVLEIYCENCKKLVYKKEYTN